VSLQYQYYRLNEALAYWLHRQLTKKKSRKSGKAPDHQILVPPKWFAEQLPPNVYIDGELWAGYGNLPNIKAHLASGQELLRKRG
jgi:hypothetical protein